MLFNRLKQSRRDVVYAEAPSRVDDVECLRETNMATPVQVVEEAEDYSFLPIIHDVIKW